jgi:hypothetical protein
MYWRLEYRETFKATALEWLAKQQLALKRPNGSLSNCYFLLFSLVHFNGGAIARSYARRPGGTQSANSNR